MVDVLCVCELKINAVQISIKMDALKLIFVLCLISICESANILYITPFTAKSHNIMLRPIGLELAQRGHNVTVITAHREKNPPKTYHEVIVDTKYIWDVLGIERPNVFDMVDTPVEKFHQMILFKGGLGMTEIYLNSMELRHFLNQDNSFDLVISEQFYQESLYILAHKYSAPLVLVTTFGNCMRHNIVNRNPLQLATVLSEFLDVKDPTGFWGRLRNFYFTVYEYVNWRFWYLQDQEALVKKYIPNLPEPVPSLYEMQKNASLILVNGHFSFDTPTAYLPNIVEVGGLHLSKSDSKLPDDLQKLLDNAEHGVVYVNFGSNVQSTELPVEKRDAFLNVFRKLKQTVLWKWEDDNLPNKPNNLIVRKWMPQKEILSHPNIKVFISHGGLIGTQEAIFHGVPIIGMPVYADQYNNLLQVENLGFGRILQYKDINEQSLQNQLNEVLRDDTYKINAMEVSRRFLDRPMNALDTAMYWIEYVIRHKGAKHMKSPAMELSWIANNMLDVYAFVLTCLMLCAYALYGVVKFGIYILNSFGTSKLTKRKRL